MGKYIGLPGTLADQHILAFQLNHGGTEEISGGLRGHLQELESRGVAVPLSRMRVASLWLHAGGLPLSVDAAAATAAATALSREQPAGCARERPPPPQPSRRRC